MWQDKIRIVVWADEIGRHKEPHCHVEWPEGAASARLTDGAVLAGDPLTHRARELFKANITAIREAWEELNP